MNTVQRALMRIAGLSYLIDAANPTQRFQRPFEQITIGPTHIDISEWDRMILLSDSLKLYNNLGPVKGAIDDKSMYSVGRAWSAKSKAKDREWAKEAEALINELWYPTADVRGSNFDFKTGLYLASVSIDREGEIFILLTESEDGWPQVQYLPTRMIGSRDLADNSVLTSGPYAGMKMIQGVIFNATGCAVAFQVLGEERKDDKFYSARDVMQVFDASTVDQVHGLPAMTHAILDLKDLRNVQGYERLAAMLMSQVGLIENNELGAPDASDPSVVLNRVRAEEPLSGPSVVTEEARGVTTRFFKAGSGGSLTQLKSERPGAAVSDFMDRLLRNAFAGFGWPYEMGWDGSKLGGANIRLLVAKAMRAVEDRQDLLRPQAKRMVGYATAKFIKLGRLRPNPEWYAWEFTLPARITADYGRDSNADRADYAANLTTMTDILAEDGISLDDHITKLKAEREALEAAGITSPIATP